MPLATHTASANRSALGSSQDTLPEDLQRQAVLRLQVLLKVFLSMHVLGVILNVVGPQVFGWASGCAHAGMASHAFGVLLTGGFLAVIQRSKRPCLMLDLGLLYQIITSFVAAFTEQTQPPGRLSMVAVLTLIFPLFVPRDARKTLFAGLLSSLAALVAVLTYHHLAGERGLTPPEVQPLVVNFLFAFLAVVPSNVMARLAREVKTARRLGAYELTEKLGSGGMGEVWRAEHRFLRRPAAVKLIRQTEQGASERTLHRFEREAQATADLESPHTVELFDFGVAQDGSLFYVMELLHGVNLEQYVSQFGPLPPGRVAFVLNQICDSLDDAHNHGLIHRDIKPANVLICRKGRMRDYVKVVDFGLVRPAPNETATDMTQTAEGKVHGTPAYMAPEAVSGGDGLDARADLYALGCLGYYLLTGRLVFPEDSPIKMAVAHAVTEPTPPSTYQDGIPEWLDALILKCLRKNPVERPTDALEVERALREGLLSTPWTNQDSALCWAKHLPELHTGSGAPAHPQATRPEPIEHAATLTNHTLEIPERKAVLKDAPHSVPSAAVGPAGA